MKNLLACAAPGLLAAALCIGFYQAPAPQFKQQLAAAHLVLMPPVGWSEIPVIHNEQMEYDYALRYSGRRLEIRYAVRPLARTAPIRGQQGRSRTQSNDSQRYAEAFRTAVFRINAGNPVKPSGMAHIDAEYSLPIIKVLAAEAAQAEYGADWVEMSPVEPGQKFGQSYKHCMLIGLYKKGVADAYCLFLFDRQQDFDNLVLSDANKAALHSLRFQ